MQTIHLLLTLLIANGAMAQQVGPQSSECSFQGQQVASERGMQKNSSDQQLEQIEDDISDVDSDVEKYDQKQERIVSLLDKFFSQEVYSFIVRTHMEKMSLCEDYKTFPGNNCHLNTKDSDTLCGGKDDVPDILKTKWTNSGGGYCTAKSSSERGSVSTAICDDSALRSSTAKNLNARECVRLLAEYRKNKNQIDKLNTKKEKLETKRTDLEMKAEIADRRSLRLDSGKSRGGDVSMPGGPPDSGETEAPCDDCMMMGRGLTPGGSRNRTNLLDNMGQVLAGLGLVWLGSKAQKNYDQYYFAQGIPGGQQNIASQYYSPAIALIGGAFNKQQNPCGQQQTGGQMGLQMQGQSYYGQHQNYGGTSIYQQQLEYAQLQNRLSGKSSSPYYNLQSVYSGYSGR